MNSDGRSEMLRPFFLFFRARAQSPTSDKPKPNKLNRKERTLAMAGTQVPGKVAKVQKFSFFAFHLPWGKAAVANCAIVMPGFAVQYLLFVQQFHWSYSLAVGAPAVE